LQEVPGPTGLSWHRKTFHGSKTRMRRRRNSCCRSMAWNWGTLSRALCHDDIHSHCSIRKDETSIKWVKCFLNWNKFNLKLSLLCLGFENTRVVVREHRWGRFVEGFVPSSWRLPRKGLCIKWRRRKLKVLCFSILHKVHCTKYLNTKNQNNYA
jgi:hypothetical protein